MKYRVELLSSLGNDMSVQWAVAARFGTKPSTGDLPRAAIGLTLDEALEMVRFFDRTGDHTRMTAELEAPL